MALVSPALRRQAQRRCRELAEEICTVISHNPLTPVGDDAPHLREAYFAADHGDGAMVRCRVDYWHYVEFGTRYFRAEPHVRPSVEFVRARHT